MLYDTLALALPSLLPVFSIERGPLLSSDVLIPLNTATFVVCVQCRETSFSIIMLSLSGRFTPSLVCRYGG
jgi:hypothetical protein